MDGSRGGGELGASADGYVGGTGLCVGDGDCVTDTFRGADYEDTFAVEVGVLGVDCGVDFAVEGGGKVIACVDVSLDLERRKRL